jgi:hypothetical protein
MAGGIPAVQKTPKRYTRPAPAHTEARPEPETRTCTWCHQPIGADDKRIIRGMHHLCYAAWWNKEIRKPRIERERASRSSGRKPAPPRPEAGNKPEERTDAMAQAKPQPRPETEPYPGKLIPCEQLPPANTVEITLPFAFEDQNLLRALQAAAAKSRRNLDQEILWILQNVIAYVNGFEPGHVPVVVEVLASPDDEINRLKRHLGETEG